jgi:hypothetical protein
LNRENDVSQEINLLDVSRVTMPPDFLFLPFGRDIEEANKQIVAIHRYG